MHQPKIFTPEGQTKWTEIELLPQWSEEFYDIYTAKKHGKWLMLKTLKPEYADQPQYQAMLEKEFDVRYNLAHPHIIMINDLEDVPGVGRSIITDDVYGDSLARLITEHRVTDHHINALTHQLIDALDYIQTNHIVHHPVRPERIIFTQNIGNLKLIDVGFDQKSHLTPSDASDDIYNFGLTLLAALKEAPTQHPMLHHIAEKCIDPDPHRRYRDITALRMALADRRQSRILIFVIAFLTAMVILLLWLNSPLAPKPI